MKKKSMSRPQSTKNRRRNIPKSIINKVGMLIGFIVPITLFISYSMDVNFFSVTKIISVFLLIICIAAYLKDEVIYPRFKVVHRGDKVGIKKNAASQTHKTKFSFSLSKGTVQMVLSILIIIICTYLGEVIYKAFG
jgi:p-aminobenzoyl-glutamate transporter AbgT